MNTDDFAALLADDLSAEARPLGNAADIRTLQDLEMVLVGGGSDGVPVF